MSLNTDIWNTAIPGTHRVTVAPPARVKVTVDGEDLGTAAEVVVNSQTFADDGDLSVDLKDLTGIAGVSFYGHVYRDLRNTNKELERKVRLADQVADSRGEDTAYWHSRCMFTTRLATERREEIEYLEAEVERLKQSRKEQAEKHKQKQANLQANFEQRNVGRVRNTKLQRELDQAKNYARALERETQELRSEQHSDLQGKLDTAVENAKYLAERSDDFESKLKHEKASSAFWHEKYLEAQETIDFQGDRIVDLVRGSNSLVESINGVSAIVDEAAEYWNEKAGD